MAKELLRFMHISHQTLEQQKRRKCHFYVQILLDQLPQKITSFSHFYQNCGTKQSVFVFKMKLDTFNQINTCLALKCTI